MIRPLPAPGTSATDWLPDYPPAPAKPYNPRSLSPGCRRRSPRPIGRPIGGEHTEHRRRQWRESKRRAAQRNNP